MKITSAKVKQSDGTYLSVPLGIRISNQVSGNIVSFSDGANAPLVDLTITITPVQSGSGDPSPINPRPISGWTGANVNVAGFNIWDEEWEVGGYNANTGVKQTDNSRIRCKNSIKCPPSTQFYFKSNFAGTVFYYDKNNNFISSQGNNGNLTFTTPSNAFAITFQMSMGYGTTYNNDIAINYPATTTAYIRYNGTTYPISWQSIAGTVYGGTLDVTTGVLTVTHKKILIKNVSFNYYSTAQLFRAALSDANAIRNDMECECLPKVTSYTTMENTDVCIYKADSNTFFIRTVNLYDNVTDLNNNLGDYGFTYGLATPITYQLTPTEVRTLLGNNNIWADTGDISVEYFTDDTQGMIEYIQEESTYNAGDKITITNKTINVGDIAPDIDARIKELKTITNANINENNIAIFKALEENQIKSLIVNITPLQEGSGDPSPTNRRPISFWYACTINNKGKNLLKYDYNRTITNNGITYTITDDGKITISGTSTETADLSIYSSSSSLALDNGIYRLITTGESQSGVYVHCKVNETDESYIDTSFGESETYTVTDNKLYDMTLRVASGVTVNQTVSMMLVKENEVDNDYEPYRETKTYEINWGTKIGAVYGGILNAKTGLLTVTWVSVNLGTLNWSKLSSGTGAHYASGTDDLPNRKYGNASSGVYGICDGYKWERNGTSSSLISNLSDKCIGYYQTNSRIMIRDDAYKNSTVEEFVAALDNVLLVYELNEPITYQLTPQNIKAFCGTNYIQAIKNDSIQYKSTPFVEVKYTSLITEDDIPKENYSTEERCIGSYLNIPLYQRTWVIQEEDLESLGDNRYMYNLGTSFIALIDVEANFATRSSTNYVYPNDYLSSITYVPNSNYLYLTLSPYSPSYMYFVTLKYIKEYTKDR